MTLKEQVEQAVKSVEENPASTPKELVSVIVEHPFVLDMLSVPAPGIVFGFGFELGREFQKLSEKILTKEN